MTGIKLMRRVFAVGLAAVVVTGCSGGPMMTSHLLDPRSPVITNGLTYALPRALVRLTVTNESTPTAPLQAGLIEYIPDTDTRYTVEVHESSWSHDNFEITTGVNELLTTVNSFSEDQTPQILQDAMSTIVNLAKIGTQLPGRAAVAREDDPKFRHVIVFDPYNFEDVARARRTIGVKVKLEISDLNGDPLHMPSRVERVKLAAECGSSLCFRLLRPVAITLTGTSGSEKLIVLLPDPNTIASYDVTRSACVKRDTKLTFVNGVLTKSTLDKPSEIAGCMKIPLEITKQLAALPGELLTFRVSVLNQESALLQSQLALLQNQQKLAEALAESRQNEEGGQ